MKEEKNDLEIIFSSIEEECAYYKTEYSKLKLKYCELQKENELLKEENKKKIENLKKERKGKKDLEIKDKKKIISPTKTLFFKDNETVFDKFFLNFEDEEGDDFEENEDLFINNNINIINEFNINNSKNNNQINEPLKKGDKIKSKDKKHKGKKEKKDKNKEESKINKNENDDVNKIIEISNKSLENIQIKNNINNFQENNNIINIDFNEKDKINDNLKDEIINNKDEIKEKENKNEEPESNEEELFLKNLIKYEKDCVSYRKLLFSNESKLSKIYLLLRKWRHYFENLKKGAKIFNKSITMFNENLAKNNDVLKKEFPFLCDQISILQKCFSTINIYCSSLITTIDSSCSVQTNWIIKDFFKELIKLKAEIYNKNNEFLLIQNKYLNTKLHKKDSNLLKEKYFNEYRNIESMKYDYCCMINKILMLTKLKIPEIICLLTYSYTVFFTSVKNEIDLLNLLVRKNLEYIVSNVKIQHKIESDMTKNKNNIIENIINNVNKSIKNKEGFLNLKEGSKFVKIYVKISDGNLIYHKLIKVDPNEENNNLNNNNKRMNLIEKIDTNNSFVICNLLLSNVKKSLENNSYPFCFEINNVNSKKPYIFQAETEKELEEWIISISNSISEQIFGFEENNKKKEKEKDEFIIIDEDIENDSDAYKTTNISNKYSSELKEIEEKKKKLEELINNNICADCGARKPTWVSINWLAMICINCSSYHRSLGVQISKIKSLKLDNILDEYLEILSVIKQNDINNILEEKINEYDKEKPKFNSPGEEKEEFIINKYKERKLMNINNEDEDKIINDIFLSIEKNDFINLYKLIKSSSIDINKIYHISNEEYGFIHHCIKFNNLFCFKLLYILGADINLVDKNGKKPIEILDNENQADFYKYLNKKENEKNK